MLCSVLCSVLWDLRGDLGRKEAGKTLAKKKKGRGDGMEPNVAVYRMWLDQILRKQPGWRRDLELAEFMTVLERWVSVLPDPERERKYPKLYALYREASRSRDLG